MEVMRFCRSFVLFIGFSVVCWGSDEGCHSEEYLLSPRIQKALSAAREGIREFIRAAAKNTPLLRDPAHQDTEAILVERTWLEMLYGMPAADEAEILDRLPSWPLSYRRFLFENFFYFTNSGELVKMDIKHPQWSLQNLLHAPQQLMVFNDLYFQGKRSEEALLPSALDVALMHYAKNYPTAHSGTHADPQELAIRFLGDLESHDPRINETLRSVEEGQNHYRIIDASLALLKRGELPKNLGRLMVELDRSNRMMILDLIQAHTRQNLLRFKETSFVAVIEKIRNLATSRAYVDAFLADLLAGARPEVSIESVKCFVIDLEIAGPQIFAALGSTH